MRISFSNGIIFAEADTFGAELISVRIDGQEKLWQGSEWPHHAPILFPVCGYCRPVIEGKEYQLKRHGFAQGKEFQVKQQRKNAVCFELCSDEETKAQFPYDFIFRVRYSLRENGLNITYEIENPADTTLYFSCGGHESFALSRPLKEYELRFPVQEKFITHLHNNDGLVTGETLSFGTGTNFPLPDDFLMNGNTLIFKNIRSRRLWLCERGGKHVAEVSFSGFPNLLLWRVDGKDMLCIEPWHNLPDGTIPVAFSEKEGIVALPPHRKKKFLRKIMYL